MRERRDAAVQFGNSRRRPHHRLHAPAARRAEQRLQGGVQQGDAGGDARELHAVKTRQAGQPGAGPGEVIDPIDR